MTDETKFVIAGGLINAALFLIGLFAASLVAGNHVTTLLALLSCGLAVLHYCAQLGGQTRPGYVLHVASNAAAAAGVLLLIRGYWL